jgi:hypothetical protein
LASSSLGELTAIAEAMDSEGLHHRSVDLGSRGTAIEPARRMRQSTPAVSYLVASEDGHISCLYRDRADPHVLLWRLGPADRRPSP